MTEIPADGLCISSFVVVVSREHPSRVLLGQINPAAPWDHLGALDPDRIGAWKDRWMLPACHLLWGEAPAEAAQRILHELTGLSSRGLRGPEVVSEVYTPLRHPSATHHWDLEFVFRTDASEAELRPLKAWNRLEFVAPGGISPGEFARSHDEVLARVGFPPRAGSGGPAR